MSTFAHKYKVPDFVQIYFRTSNFNDTHFTSQKIESIWGRGLESPKSCLSGVTGSALFVQHASYNPLGESYFWFIRHVERTGPCNTHAESWAVNANQIDGGIRLSRWVGPERGPKFIITTWYLCNYSNSWFD